MHVDLTWFIWTAMTIIGFPLSVYFPILAFPLCLQTFPLERSLLFVYLVLIASACMWPVLAVLAPLCLLFGSNGAFYLDHITMSIALYATLWSDVLRLSTTALIIVYNGHFKFKHEKHITIF